MKATECIGVELTQREAEALKQSARKARVSMDKFIENAIVNFIHLGVQTPRRLTASSK